MAVMTSPHLSDIASSDQKQPPKMASLADESAPTSNGVNGHSLSDSKDSMVATPPEVASKSTESAAAAPASDAALNSAQNADAFSSNTLAVQPPSNTEHVAAENLATSEGDSKVKSDSAVAPEVPGGPAESAEKSSPKPAEEPPKEPTEEKSQPPAEKSPEESADNPTLEPAEEPPAALEEKKDAFENEDLSVAAPAAPEEPAVSVESAAETKPQSENTAVEASNDAPKSTAEEPKAASAEEAKPAESKTAGVEMSSDHVSNKPAVAESVAPDKTEDTVMADAPAAAPHPHTSASSLLPSLRDDGPREHSSVTAAADTVMTDAPSNKVAREREDDHKEERSAKRAKTEDAETSVPTAGDSIVADVPPIVLPPRVRAAAKPGSLADPKLDSLPISPYANREIRRVLASVKKTKVGNNFKDPVFKKWPGLWDSYTLRVSKPMDISQMERNLRENAYATHAAFIDDIFLIHENSLSFNGAGNTITDEAKALVDNFFTRLSDITAAEPQKPEKKEPKQLPTRQTEPRAAASRRESKGAASSPIEDSVTAAGPLSVSTSTAAVAVTPAPTAPAAPAATPVEVTTPVFAVPAGGVPIIRRDSAKNDGDRPKRPIHPPKNRDLGYEPKNPKKKQPEFRFCEEVLKELMKIKHYDTNHWFLRPVDPVAMQIPTYHKVIKKPMDLGTMQTKLSLGEYNSAKEFENDVNLIIKNCRKFNIMGEVVDAANRLEELFKQKWSEKDSWISAHTAPPVVPSSVAVKEEGSDEEGYDSEAEGEEPTEPLLTSDTVDALVKRLQEENTRLTNLLSEKIPNMTDITTQQTVVNILQKQIVEEKTKLAAAESDKRAKKPAKAKTAKGKKAAGGAGTAKKASGGVGGGTANKKQVISSKKAPKARVLGQAEKTVVTDGINNLDGSQLEKAVDIIMKDTHQEESESGELELDIDQLSQDALGKLYDLIVKAFPHMRVKHERPAKNSSAGDGALGKPSKPKKHKPMGKLEQERNIEKLREIKAQFQRPGSGSQEPLPSVEVNQPTREEESEEESDADSEEE